MPRYANLGGDSGVESYEIGDDSITVVFSTGVLPYRYTYASAGAANIEQMKSLAQRGEGLNEFINRYVRDKYER